MLAELLTNYYNGGTRQHMCGRPLPRVRGQSCGHPQPATCRSRAGHLTPRPPTRPIAYHRMQPLGSEGAPTSDTVFGGVKHEIPSGGDSVYLFGRRNWDLIVSTSIPKKHKPQCGPISLVLRYRDPKHVACLID